MALFSQLIENNRSYIAGEGDFRISDQLRLGDDARNRKLETINWNCKYLAQIPN